MLSPESTSRAIHLISLAGVLILLLFVPLNVLRGVPELAWGNLILIGIIGLNLLHYRKYRRPDLTSRVGLLAVVAFTVAYILFLGLQIYFWIFVVPMAALLLLGRRSGIALIAFSGLAFAIAYFFRADRPLDEWVWADLLFSFLQVSILAAIAQHINDSQRRELERLSRTDRLTGAWNRHKIEEIMDRECSMAERHRHPLSLILFDIDHFKAINDEHGHLVGDRVLSEIATVTRATVRSTDYFVRWGGEEFLVLLPSTSLEQAFHLAERLREAILEHDFSVRSVTISSGIGAFEAEQDGLSRQERVDALLRSADNALYRAKAGGRNRVEIAGTTNTP